MIVRLLRSLGLVAALGMLVISSAAAQTPDSLPPTPADTGRAESADTLRRGPTEAARPDTSSTDSLRATERFLRLQDRIKVQLPVAPRLGIESPRPAGSRIVFTRDSLAWVNGESVGDLLGQVEGAYVWRGGWLGRAEYGNFRGRGGASVEYLLDGVPYGALGVDSIAVDAGRLPLSLFDRVEIERLPAALRVHLFTARTDRLAAKSRIQIGTGNDGLTRFSAALEQRGRNGFGVSLMTDYLNTTSSPTGANAYRNTHLGALLQYVPSPRYGVELLYLRNQPVRDPFLRGVEGGVVAVDSGLADRRGDTRLRAFWRAQEDGRGLGLDVIAMRTSVTDTIADSLAQAQFAERVQAIGVIVGLRGTQAFVTAEGWGRSGWTTGEARVRSGLTIGPSLALSADGLLQRHAGGRQTRWAAGRASWRGPLGLSLEAAARTGRLVAAPSLRLDSAQSIVELEGRAALDLPSLSLHGSVTRTSAFTPSTYAVFPGIAQIGRAEQITWISGGGRLRPFSWLTLESWGSTPLEGVAVGQPPRHAISSGTIRTKFLRAFPSGVLDLRMQLGVEYWDAFTVGFDGVGEPITLPTTTAVFAQVQLQLQSFSVYFQQRNTAGRRVEYVPGFPIPGFSNSFGIRWSFIN